MALCDYDCDRGSDRGSDCDRGSDRGSDCDRDSRCHGEKQHVQPRRHRTQPTTTDSQVRWGYAWAPSCMPARTPNVPAPDAADYPRAMFG